MTEGYVSDVPGDDTVMDSPTVEVRIDLTDLPPEQALALIQQGFQEQVEPWKIGALAKGDDVTDELGAVAAHLPLGPALTALAEIGVVDLPEEPPTDPTDVMGEEQA